MRILVDDLKKLETEGIVSEGVTFKGSLVAVLGDNLGSHQIGGFIECFSTPNQFCRYCDQTLREFRKNPFEKKPFRTIEQYNENASEAIRLKKLVNGIKSNSLLNTLEHFHVCSPGLPPCIAHDLLEGVVAHDLWLAMKYFVDKKWFKCALFNYRVNNVMLSITNYEFIPFFNPKSILYRLTGSATQIKKLLMIFPVAIADLIKDFDDNVWQLVLKLRELTNYIFAPALSNSQLQSLGYLTTEFLELRIKCFPNVKLRPKHHFITHYENLIRIFGPLKHLWTLRCESKHKYFKKVVKNSQNFKNVTQTLAEKHELLQCSFENQYSCILETENLVKYSPQLCDPSLVLAITEYFVDNLNKVQYMSKKVTFRGITYAKDMAICIGKNIYGYFEICNIELILIDDASEIYFIGKTEEIVYCSELGVYEKTKCAGSTDVLTPCVIPFSSLLSLDPLIQSNVRSVSVFLTKYAIYERDV